MKNNLWKGIAIVGIWVAQAAIVWAIVYYKVSAHDTKQIDLSFLGAFIATWIIAVQ